MQHPCGGWNSGDLAEGVSCCTTPERRTRFGMDLDPKEAAELLGRMQEEFIARRQATD